MGDTGECTPIVATRKTDVSALTAPPLSGGPWHGTIFFYWSQGGGLYGVKWANEGGRVSHIGTARGTQPVRTLAFSEDGTLCAAGRSGLQVVDPFSGMVTHTFDVPVGVSSLMWMPR